MAGSYGSGAGRGGLDRRTFLGAAAALALARGAPARDRLALKDRWVYVQTNLQTAANVPPLEDLFRRAAKAGYTGVLLADSKFARLGTVPAGYFANADRVKRAARENRLEIVPCVFPLGYSESMLFHDPNLAEGLPVRDAPFLVRGGEARPAPDPVPGLRGGDFADLRAWDWKDDCVVADGGAALARDPRGANARIVQKVRIAPWRQYHLSVRVRTREFRGEPRIAVLAGGRELHPANLGVKPTQDWTEHHAVFNSLGNAEAAIYLGAWGAGTGSLWWEDARLEEAGLLNLVRRDGAPLAVRREDGTPLVEGRDFEAILDPRMGSVPWPGAFEVWHEPPPIRTRLPDGTRLRASYFHAITVHDGQVMICPSEPRTLELLKDEARRVRDLFGARSHFMSHDEIRVLGWDDACARRKITPGAILADNVRACSRILREAVPGGRIFAWSDMFDPNHNARDGYYLVNGDLAGAWEGLERDVIVGAWNFEKRKESLAWFAGRGHRSIIAGYYDAPPERVRDWLDAARGVEGVGGAIYTTWQGNYRDLEEYARIVEEAR